LLIIPIHFMNTGELLMIVILVAVLSVPTMEKVA